jgi:SPP1 family predicted phage head-tail adaptor
MIQGPEIFDKRITLQHKTRVPDGMGNFTETWADWKTIWAKDTPFRSNEAIEAMKTTGKLTHNWRIRYIAGATGHMRIKYGNRYMAITGPPIEVNKGTGQHYLDIVAEEVK